MKTLILVRHASSGWKSAGQQDIDRTLDQAGKQEALQMASRLKKRKIVPDYFISSPAARAIETADHFLKSYNRNIADLHLEATLYLADISAFYKTIESITDENHTALLISHNPGITTFINDLDCQPVLSMPTCGVYALQSDTEQWKDFRIAEKQFLLFDFPGKKE